MKKKLNRHSFSICIMAVLLLTVIIASIATSTARFSTLVSSDSSSRGAKWWFKVNEYDAYNTEQFTIDLASTADENGSIKSGSVAPSSTGSFELVIDCSSCEVDITWVVTFNFKDASSNYPNIVFWIGTSGQADYQEIEIGKTSLTGEIKFDENNMESQVKTITVNWKWPVDTTLDETEFSGKNFDYICTITATQIQ